MTNTNGLTSKDFVVFKEMMIKGNTLQLKMMSNDIKDELRRRVK